MPGDCPAVLLRAAALAVENIPLQGEPYSGRRHKAFALPPERRSPLDRNAVRNHNGIVFAFERIPHLKRLAAKNGVASELNLIMRKLSGRNQLVGRVGKCARQRA